MKKLGPEEEGARTILSRAMRRSVRRHDDGTRDGMYDLSVFRVGSVVAAAEVTIAADQDSIKLSVELSKVATLQGGIWTDRGLRGGWLVSIDRSYKGMKKLVSGLPLLLAKLEAMNRKALDAEHDSGADPLVAEAIGLGVLSARQSATTSNPGSIYPTVDSRGLAGFVAETGDAVATWIGGFLAADERRDVRKKLAASGLAARHAFVWVPLLLGTAPFGVVEVLTRHPIPLPTAAPQLPNEVTHVWVASTWDGGLRWAPRKGWSSYVSRAPQS